MGIGKSNLFKTFSAAVYGVSILCMGVVLLYPAAASLWMTIPSSLLLSYGILSALTSGNIPFGMKFLSGVALAVTTGMWLCSNITTLGIAAPALLIPASALYLMTNTKGVGHMAWTMMIMGAVAGGLAAFSHYGLSAATSSHVVTPMLHGLASIAPHLKISAAVFLSANPEIIAVIAIVFISSWFVLRLPNMKMPFIGSSTKKMTTPEKHPETPDPFRDLLSKDRSSPLNLDSKPESQPAPPSAPPWAPKETHGLPDIMPPAQSHRR